MWLTLSDGVFFFGSGGVTAIKSIDLRDKPVTFLYRSELFQGSVRVGFTMETAEEIKNMLDLKLKTNKRSKE
jgi:hypothetical protein